MLLEVGATDTFFGGLCNGRDLQTQVSDNCWVATANPDPQTFPQIIKLIFSHEMRGLFDILDRRNRVEKVLQGD